MTRTKVKYRESLNVAFLKKTFVKLAVLAALIVPSFVNADQAKGLNMIVNSANYETQVKDF